MIILSWMSPDYSRTFCSLKAGCNFNLRVCFETVCYKVTWQFSVMCLQLVDPLHLVTGVGSDCSRITTPCQDRRKQHAPSSVIPGKLQ